MLRHQPCRGQRGLSLVELMVGIAVGMFVVAGAGLVVSTQLGDNRRLLLETQLQQDMRASADIITRELRRAGGWAVAEQGVWQPGLSTVVPNAYNTVAPIAAPDSELTFRYVRRPGDEGPFGFRQDDNGALRSLVGGAWQELTDSNVMRITAFNVTPLAPATFQVPCPRECPGGGTACWPTLSVRNYVIDISAQARNDPNVQRSLRARVRLRNDRFAFDPASPAQVCPP